MLDDCLDAVIERGQTLEEALARFPEHAERLRPELEGELEAAGWLAERRAPLEARQGFVSASKARLLSELEAAPAPRGGMGGWLAGRLAGYTLGLTRMQLAGRLALAVMLLVSIWFSFDRSFQASRTSLPGDPLYTLKLASENVRLWVAPGAAGQASLHTEFARLRLMELQSLVFEGRYEHIADTVARYEFHVGRAVSAVSRVSGRDADQAQVHCEAAQPESCDQA